MKNEINAIDELHANGPANVGPRVWAHRDTLDFYHRTSAELRINAGMWDSSHHRQPESIPEQSRVKRSGRTAKTK